MNFGVILLDLILAIPLFFFLNYFDSGKKEDTVEINITHIVFPLVYIVMLSALFASLHWNILIDNIFLIPVFECIYRIIYINRVLNRDSLINHKYYYIINAVTIILSYVLYTVFISKVENVLPAPSEFRGEIWFLIIIFLYTILKDKVHVDFLKEKSTLMERKKEYVVMSYAKLKNQYRSLVTTKESTDLIPILYAIMIYENFVTPPAIRTIKEYLYRFTNKEMKCGIMQISTKEFLTDEESIGLAMKQLEKIDKKLGKDPKKLTGEKRYEKLLTLYRNDSDYVKNVLTIFHMITEFDK